MRRARTVIPRMRGRVGRVSCAALPCGRGPAPDDAPDPPYRSAWPCTERSFRHACADHGARLSESESPGCGTEHRSTFGDARCADDLCAALRGLRPWVRVQRAGHQGAPLPGLPGGHGGRAAARTFADAFRLSFGDGEFCGGEKEVLAPGIFLRHGTSIEMVDCTTLKHCASELPNQLVCLSSFRGFCSSSRTTQVIPEVPPAPAALTAPVFQRPRDTPGRSAPAPTPCARIPKRFSPHAAERWRVRLRSRTQRG